MSLMAPVYAALARAALVVSTLLLASCTSNPYYIGAACQGCGGSAGNAGSAGSATSGGTSGAMSNLSFAIDLSQTGASLLPAALEVPGGAIPASLVFHGESATASAWLADQGPRLLRADAPPALNLEAPFTDGTRALGLTPLLATYVAESADTGSVATDDFALEVVLRAAPGGSLFDRRGSAAGWSLEATSNGALVLTVQDAQRALQISTEPLVSRAWYHCLFWISRGAGGRADCDGREGALGDLSALGSLAGTAKLSVGGGPSPSEIALEVAYFALFRAGAGGLGPAATWGDVSRRRFAALTGISPRVARGTPIPRNGVREAPAYLDLLREGSGLRSLFLVGQDWPRIACRNDANGVRVCGYFGEAQRSRSLDSEASAWTASGFSVSANHALFADGERTMSGLVPSTMSAPQTLTWTGTYAGTRQAFSFFARAGAGQFVALSASGFGRAVFDLRAGSLVSATPDVRASIEDWGAGLYRCAYLIEPGKGELTYELALLTNPDAQTAAGDGVTVFADVAALQVDVGQAYPGSPFAVPIQAGDRLSFIADDGNLPSTDSVSQRMRVLLPAGPRLTDQAMLNLNRDGSFDDQVQLYITGDTSELKFWGLRDGATHWAFDHPVSLVDGVTHTVQADWGPAFAELSVDGVSLQQTALVANDPPFSLNRIDVSFSANSSGSLEGLLGSIEIGPRATP